MRARFANLRDAVLSGCPSSLQKFITSEVKFSGAKPD
jgi:hypothetical protein